MGGNKRRRKKSKVKDGQPPSDNANEGDSTKDVNDGVDAQLEFKGEGKNNGQDVPQSWSVEYVQEIQKKSPTPIISSRSEDVPSVKDIGLQMVRGTLERIASRNNKKSNKKSKSVVKPTPVQLRLWPALLDSFDKKESECGESKNGALNVVGIAPTGTGKTMAYCIPIIAQCVRTLLYQSILSSKKETKQSTNVHALVLLPTRELAIQVSKEFKVAAKVAKKYLSKCLKEKDDDDATTMKVESMAIYGGVEIQTQINTLLGKEVGEEEATVGHKSLVVAATAGRLLDILKRSSESDKEEVDKEEGESVTSAFANLQAIVFDEADRVAVNADMAGQVDEILDILKRARNNNDTTGDAVTCLVSATLPEKAKEMCEKWVPRDRLVVKVDSVKVGQKQVNNEAVLDAPIGNKESSKQDPESSAKEGVENDGKKSDKHLLQNLDLASIPSNIDQTLHVCSNHKKPKKLILTLRRIYLNKSATQHGGRFSVNNRLCIVFFAQIKTLKYMSNLLVKEGLRCVELYGSLNQTEREKRLLDFKAGKRPILLATDVAARGLHIPNVHFVVNYDFPGSLDQYVHRCGRAGRKQALSGEDSKEYPPTVYSFYNRELSAMASSVVELLKACNAWVDPNLLELVKEKMGSSADNANKSSRKRKRKASSTKSETERNKTDKDDDESQSDNNDQFAFLGRSALKRASHVSDAEDSGNDESS